MRDDLRLILLCLIVTAISGCSAIPHNQMRYGNSSHNAPNVARSLSPKQQAETQPTDQKQELNRAVDLVTQMNYGPAERILESLVSHDDPHVKYEALFWLGYCAEKQGHTDKAIRLYRRLDNSQATTDASRMAQQRLRNLDRGK